MDMDSNQFLLGEINATVKGTSDDVKALRLEMGMMASELSKLAIRVTTIEADRDAMKPDYVKHVHKMNNHVQADMAWKAAHEAEKATTRRHFYVMSVLTGLAFSAGTFLIRAFVG
jgi:hypothetical protein